MNQLKTILLCADDFGLSPGISDGILKLARMHRLSAVSCMVNTESFVLAAPQLLSLKDQVQIGLHFNLTDGYLLSKVNQPVFSLKKLLLKTHLNLMDAAFLKAELNAQLDRFIDVMGRLPDFIDGHQHIHQFPQIRQAVLELYKQRLQHHQVTVRSTWPALSMKKHRFKTKILALTGGKGMQRQLLKLDIPHNHYFSGVYDFSPDTDYRSLFRHWLGLSAHQTFIMCHPGAGDMQDDPISAARNRELSYLQSEQFITDCDEFYVKLATGPKT